MTYRTCESCYRDGAKKFANKMTAQIDTTDTSQSENIETQQITTFVQDESVTTSVKDEIPFAPKWNNHAQDLLQHDILAILRRPVEVSSGKLTPTFAFTPLAMPDALIAASANIRAKLAYFTFMRANLRVKLVFTATPFMSGKYLMWFSPYDGFSNRPIPKNLTCRTGYPCVELDIATGSSVELKIPYCSPLSHFDLLKASGYMGRLYIDAITGTLEGTTPSLGAPYTLYAWFEDVELSMPNSRQPATIPAPPAPLFAQILSEESVKVKTPSVSALAGGVATTAKLFSNIVPRWFGFLKPVEWVARAIGGAASAAGLNKPTDLTHTMAVYNLPAKGFTNMDGLDAGVTLGATPDNALTLPSGLFSTDVDEMDLGYVCKNACICTNSIPWSIDDTAGEMLFSFPVTPGFCPTASPSIFPTVMGYVASMFERWTGGLRYRLAVSKTAFHSGKLRITFHPSHFDPDASNTVLENAYNWILDLNVSSEIDFTIPYVSNTQWKEVILGDFSNVGDVKFSTGMITISVMTPLVAASAQVSKTAPFYIWISAADDFSLAIPSCPRYVPQEFVPTVFEEEETMDEGVLFAQIFNATGPDVSVSQDEQDQGIRLFPMSKIHPTLPEQLTIGEKISSLRQVIKRFGKTCSGGSSPYPNEAGNNYSHPGPFPVSGLTQVTNQVYVDPAFLGTNAVAYTNSRKDAVVPKLFSNGTTLTTDGAIVSAFFQSQNPLHYLSYLYTFWTGSKRYKLFVGQGTTQFPTSGNLHSTDFSTFLVSDTFIPKPRSQIPIRIMRLPESVENSVVHPPSASNATLNAYVDRVDGRFESIVYPDLDGCAEFTVPYYGKTPISLICQGNTSSVRGTLLTRNKIVISKGIQVDDSVHPFFSYKTESDFYATYTGRTIEDFGAFALYEAAGDDFSFGYLHGAPTVLNTNAF